MWWSGQDGRRGGAGISCLVVDIAEPLTLDRLEAVARGAAPPRLDGAARERIRAARAVVEDAVERGDAVYGVTTGIGELASVRIEPADAERLQLNLLRSHAVGSGEPLPEEVVRAMMLLLAASLARGHSGVRAELVELLLALLERGVVPMVPSRGSVGSSGDLAPLAHLGLVLVGEGEAFVEGERLSGEEALRRAGLEPLRLTAKEGLALINGTHLMAAVGSLAVTDARRVLSAATSSLRPLPRGLQGLHRPLRRPPPGPAPAAGPGARRGAAAPPARGQRGRGQPRRLRARAGPLHAQVRAAGDRRRGRRARLRARRPRARAVRRDRQPARVPGQRRRRRRRQLPRPAAVAAARPPRARADRACLLQRAPHLRAAVAELRRAAALPVSHARPRHRPDDRPVRGGRARERVPGAGPPRRRRLDPHVGRPGGLQLDGRLGRAEGPRRRGARGDGDRHRAGLRLPGARVPPAASHDSGARGRGGPSP